MAKLSRRLFYHIRLLPIPISILSPWAQNASFHMGTSTQNKEFYCTAFLEVSQGHEINF
jgi:hypothetical protein